MAEIGLGGVGPGPVVLAPGDGAAGPRQHAKPAAPQNTKKLCAAKMMCFFTAKFKAHLQLNKVQPSARYFLSFSIEAMNPAASDDEPLVKSVHAKAFMISALYYSSQMWVRCERVPSSSSLKIITPLEFARALDAIESLHQELMNALRRHEDCILKARLWEIDVNSYQSEPAPTID